MELDGVAAFLYFRWRRRLVTGVAPGLQNQCQAERSEVGSTPIRFRQLFVIKPHKVAKALWGFLLSCFDPLMFSHEGYGHTSNALV